MCFRTCTTLVCPPPSNPPPTHTHRANMQTLWRRWPSVTHPLPAVQQWFPKWWAGSLWDHIVIAAGQIDISLFFILPDTKTLICNCIFIFYFFNGNIPKELGDHSTVTSSVKLWSSSSIYKRGQKSLGSTAVRHPLPPRVAHRYKF